MAKPKLKKKSQSSSQSSSSQSASSRGSGSKGAGGSATKTLMETAQQIWMAGMGAFGRAQEEGGKLFETLAREGLSLEQKTRNFATARADAARDAMETTVNQVRERTQDTWDKLDRVFQERVSRSLNRLGVPGRDEMQALIARVDELNRQVRNMNAQNAGAAAAKRGAARKAAAASAAPSGEAGGGQGGSARTRGRRGQA